MGFTPLEGLVMATRSGSVDPGLLLWLLEHERPSEHEMATALEHDSGLEGLAGSADMQEVLARAAGGDERAGLAIEVYVHRLTGQIAAMVAALGGIDALVFTAGVGEHGAGDPRPRSRGPWLSRRRAGPRPTVVLWRRCGDRRPGAGGAHARADGARGRGDGPPGPRRARLDGCTGAGSQW